MDPVLAKHISLMRVAIEVACMSKCKRAQYGTVITDRQGRIIATGYNGKPMGSCNDGVCYREGLAPDAAKEKCCLHSEQNALCFANYSDMQRGTLYVTGLPCTDCALMIAQSGVSLLVCMDDVRGYTGIETLITYGFSVDHGKVVDGQKFYSGPVSILVLDMEQTGLKAFWNAVNSHAPGP